jgi:hypothetical protein
VKEFFSFSPNLSDAKLPITTDSRLPRKYLAAGMLELAVGGLGGISRVRVPHYDEVWE